MRNIAGGDFGDEMFDIIIYLNLQTKSNRAVLKLERKEHEANTRTHTHQKWHTTRKRVVERTRTTKRGVPPPPPQLRHRRHRYLKYQKVATGMKENVITGMDPNVATGARKKIFIPSVNTGNCWKIVYISTKPRPTISWKSKR